MPLPTQAFVDLLGARVHWADFGPQPGTDPVDVEAPDVLCVMVHGLGGSTVNWESLVPLLGPTMRCVALDLVGFGMTDPGKRTASVPDNTDLVAAFIDFVRAQHPQLPLLLIGNSMGGLISARYAARKDSDVAGLVLLDPTVPPASLLPGPGGVLAAGLYAVPPVGQAAAKARRSLRSPEQNVGDTLRLCTVDPSRVDPDVVERHLPVAERRVSHPEMDRHYSDAARSILGQLARRRHTDEMFASITAPVLLIHGTRDRLVPFSGAVRAAGRNPHWRFAPAADTGHLPMLESPAWTQRQISAWWCSPDVLDWRHG
ncbi:MAG: alpha/beta fold hydrolase [Ornithinimicrobium sp.]